jgi:hypothetical protein
MSRSLAFARTLGAVIGAAALGLCGPGFGADPERDDSALTRSILASAGANAALIARILDAWESYARALGRDPREWREQTSIALRYASAEDLRGIAAIVPVDGQQNGERYARVQALVGGEAIKAADRKGEVTAKLGSATTDQVFFPITPCRIVDTRFATNGSYAGPIAAGTQRNFYFYVASDATWRWSTQGGPDALAYQFCPGTVLTAINGGTLGGVPSAAVATVTVVNATAAGNFIVWGGLPLGPGSPYPVTSALNWSGPGQVLANTTVIPYGGRSGGALDFTVRYNGPTGQADVIVDVIGYFLRNDATALDCTVVEQPGSSPNPIANGSSFVIETPDCPTGYRQTGSACKYNGVAMAGLALQGNYYANYPACHWRNQTGGNVAWTSFYAVSYCCRVPGK